MKTSTLVAYWTVRILAALIMLQTLYFKFSGAEESVYIFSTVGMEPWGRIGVGMLEGIAAALILINSTVWIGAVLTAGLMGGALAMHLTVLGISVKDDGGYLFFLALLVFVCSLFMLWFNTNKIRSLVKRIM
jgi:putative oxidoreductase